MSSSEARAACISGDRCGKQGNRSMQTMPGEMWEQAKNRMAPQAMNTNAAVDGMPKNKPSQLEIAWSHIEGAAENIRRAKEGRGVNTWSPHQRVDRGHALGLDSKPDDTLLQYPVPALIARTRLIRRKDTALPNSPGSTGKARRIRECMATVNATRVNDLGASRSRV